MKYLNHLYILTINVNVSLKMQRFRWYLDDMHEKSIQVTPQCIYDIPKTPIPVCSSDENNMYVPMHPISKIGALH